MGIEPTTLSLGSFDLINKNKDILAKPLLSDLKRIK
jgi:hypothetical protein